MAYSLKSKVNFGKYKDMTVQECIDKYYYAWKNIINKNISWYDSEVLNYLSNISKTMFLMNKQSDYKSWMNRDNT